MSVRQRIKPRNSVGRPGRPSMGPRDAWTIRPPEEMGDSYRERAKRAGLTLSDYVLAKLELADEAGIEPSTPAGQEPLPIEAA